jgi:hypothetical protein
VVHLGKAGMMASDSYNLRVGENVGPCETNRFHTVKIL